MRQGKRSVTEYWNEFCLVATEAELDDSTGGELLLGGMITELQNAWGASSEEYEDLEAVIAGSPPILLSLIVGKIKCDGKASVTCRFLFFRKKILIATGFNGPHPNPPNRTQATNNNRPSALTPSPSVKHILELALCPPSWHQQK